MGVLLVSVGLVVFLGVAIKIYNKITAGWCSSQVCLVGKTAVVTGANVGIGYETALDFAKRGARVILACRDRQRAEEARSKIIEETGNPNVEVKIIDMASFESVRNFARDINETEPRLDILVNNAGIFIGLGDARTKDGHSLIMQVNHYSGFLLTNLLKDLLLKSAPSRIVNVSSELAKIATSFDVDTIDTHIADWQGYSTSKLCNVLFTIELAKKIEGTGVTAYSLHPGAVQTEILRNYKGILAFPFSIVAKYWNKTAEEGAQTTIYCSIARGIEKYNGQTFADCSKIGRYNTALDPTLPKKLWEKTEKIVNFKSNESKF